MSKVCEVTATNQCATAHDTSTVTVIAASAAKVEAQNLASAQAACTAEQADANFAASHDGLSARKAICSTSSASAKTPAEPTDQRQISTDTPAW